MTVLMNRISLAISLFLFSFQSLKAQPAANQDIDALKQNLQHLRGRAKVDGLNAICETYFNIGFFGEKDKRVDSIETYALMAYAEAGKLNYQEGKAYAQLYIAFTETIRRKFTDAEKRLTGLLTTVHDHRILGHAHSFLANIYNDHYNQTDKAIEFLKKALSHFQAIQDQKETGLALTRLCMMYTGKGDYKSGVEYCTGSVRLAKTLAGNGGKDGWIDYQILQSYSLIINLYKVAGDPETAMDYQKELASYAGLRKFPANIDVDMGILYRLLGKYDSSIIYLKKYIDKNPTVMWAKFQLAQTHLKAKNYREAESLIHQCIDTFQKRNKGKTTMNYSVYAGKLYLEKGDDEKAMFYARQTFQSSQVNNDYNFLVDRYDLLEKAYARAGISDSAYFYLQKNAALKDSVITRQFLFRLNNFKREAGDEIKAAQMAMLKKDILIKTQQLQQEQLLKEQSAAEMALMDRDNRIKDQQLKQEAVIKEQKETELALLDRDNKLLDRENQLKKQQLTQQVLLRNILAAGLLGIILIGIFIYRNQVLKTRNENLQRMRLENEMKMHRLENEKKQAELLQQASELKMQALKAQMNPHFIFNCLSSINRFILKNESQAASDYLTRFSRLMRMVLVNSQRSWISLEDELEMLRLYLYMERLRFTNSFDFQITCTEETRAGSIFIPPLLLQPFCENAIWHGLMNKQEAGQLKIRIDIGEEILNCTITDNGIGREKAAALKSKSAEKGKSYGLKITTERLSLLNRENGNATHYQIEDLIDENGMVAGTKVNLKIRYKESVEDYVS
jgi:hypothetical protein